MDYQRMARPDYRSPEAQVYRRWYKSARWQKLRARQLQHEPLCRMCKAQGQVTEATICDHLTPHKGNETAFWSGPFQSLCKLHHDSSKQSEERTGRKAVTIGVDGWPV